MAEVAENWVAEVKGEDRVIKFIWIMLKIRLEMNNYKICNLP